MVDLGSHTVGRWLNLEREITALFKQYMPDKIIVEENFVFRNPKSTALLNQLRGCVLLLAALHGVSVTFLDNNSTKKKILGTTKYWDSEQSKYVGVTKDMMLKGVQRALCDSSVQPITHDAADAIALALTYFDASVPTTTLPRKP